MSSNQDGDECVVSTLLVEIAQVKAIVLDLNMGFAVVPLSATLELNDQD